MERIEGLDLIVLNLGHAQTVHHWGNRDISSPFARIYYPKSGRAVLHLPTGDKEITPGHMYFVPTHMPHSYECDPGFEFYYLFVFQRSVDGQDVFSEFDFPLEVNSNEATQLLFENYCNLYPQLNLPTEGAQQFDKHPAFYEYVEAYKHMAPYEKLQLNGLVEILLSYFVKYAQPKREITDSRVQYAIKYANEHIHEVITIDQLMGGTPGKNQSHFIEIFYHSMQQTPLQYVVQRKIQIAQNLLLATDWAVYRISHFVGYDDQSYFIRLFRKHTGITPQEYRKRLIG